MNTLPPPIIDSQPERKTSRLAVAAFILSLLCWTGVTTPVSLLVGIIARRRIKRSPATLKGESWASAAIVLSGFGLIFLILANVPGDFIGFQAERKRAQRRVCRERLGQLTEAVLKYASQHDGQFPAAQSWSDEVENLLPGKDHFSCPAAGSGHRSDYGFNAKLDGMALSQVNSNTVVLFEIDGGWNVSGGRGKLIPKERHWSYTVSFADGRVEHVNPGELDRLRWDP